VKKFSDEKLNIMKRIEAIIKPHKIDDVFEALKDVGVAGLTHISVRGYGRQRGHTEIYRGSEYTVDFLPKEMIIVYVTDEQATTVVEAIARAANTGKIGDGKIAVMNLEEVLRIRTGERGREAI
jgi:nitrogen regulatory protein PII